MSTNTDILVTLTQTIARQQKLINDIATHLNQIESIGGGGSASIADYTINTKYKRNTLIVDTNTETVYRVLVEYTSVDFDTDLANGKLKLVGYESQLVTFNHNPTQDEITALPDDTLVAVYSSTDQPYIPNL